MAVSKIDLIKVANRNQITIEGGAKLSYDEYRLALDKALKEKDAATQEKKAAKAKDPEPKYQKPKPKAKKKRAKRGSVPKKKAKVKVPKKPKVKVKKEPKLKKISPKEAALVVTGPAVALDEVMKVPGHYLIKALKELPLDDNARAKALGCKPNSVMLMAREIMADPKNETMDRMREQMEARARFSYRTVCVLKVDLEYMVKEKWIQILPTVGPEPRKQKQKYPGDWEVEVLKRLPGTETCKSVLGVQYGSVGHMIYMIMCDTKHKTVKAVREAHAKARIKQDKVIIASNRDWDKLIRLGYLKVSPKRQNDDKK